MLFIINPTAARGRALREWTKVRQQLIARGIGFKEHLTSGSGEAIEVTRQALLAGESRVVAVGGDGTLNEVVNGYFDETGQAINSEAAIGLLPCGTGSDFRRTVGFNKRAVALAAIASDRTRLIDVLKVELQGHDGSVITRHSINIVSLGLGGEVVTLVNSWRKSWPNWISGHFRFVAAALKALNTYQNRPVQILLVGQTGDNSNQKPERGNDLYLFSNFLVVANGRFAGGGMKFAPHAEIDDGLLDIVLTDKVTRWDIIKELPRIRFGAYLRNPKVKLVKSREVTIKSWPALAVDIDGETAGFTPARLVVKPSVIRFLVGESS